MKKILNLTALVCTTTIFAFSVANSQTVQSVPRENWGNKQNHNDNSWNTNWGNMNLGGQVFNFIEQRWGNYISPEQKIQQLERVVQFLNQKIADIRKEVNNRKRFSANPTYGKAPLTVSFTNYYGNRLGSYTLDYGDGTNEKINNCYAPYDYCINPGRNSHTYRYPGTFTVRVVQNFCPRGSRCFAAEKVVDSVQIRVVR